MQNKRSMRADEAKSLSILKQRLSKASSKTFTSGPDLSETQKNPFVYQGMSRGDELVFLCFELALLLSVPGISKQVLPLSGLGLVQMPETLEGLPDLAKWYESFGGLEGVADIFDSLDLRRNNLTSLPEWLPTTLPKLRCLYISNNPMPPSPIITAFQDLETLEADSQAHLTTNSTKLLQQAIAYTESNIRSKAFIAPLTSICVEKLKAYNYELSEDVYPNIEAHWNIKRYICASCKAAIYPEDPKSIPTPLRERYYHFNPPVARLSDDGQLPPDTARTSRVFTSSNSTFCAPCLVLHCKSDLEDGGGCMCASCYTARQSWRQTQSIRWARLRVAL
ncbi:hypothetical protein P389DRAFT_55190 [Cystobasidium minutum MCA 4210]|uniref:uncharacterized protein n=1 Tax=Cystobasidium minutum MCA 4210 TaxID=1397322 RepID=UPI0034CE898A|eukprot:jgi/Rhomi1/55190/CE55189_282